METIESKIQVIDTELAPMQSIEAEITQMQSIEAELAENASLVSRDYLKKIIEVLNGFNDVVKDSNGKVASAEELSRELKLFIEHLTSEIDTSDANNVGKAKVEFITEGIFKKFKFSNLKGDKGEPGQTGEKGDTGEGFSIYRTYETIEQMEADAANVEEGKFVLISNDVENEDNAKLYVKTESEFNFLIDLSGAKGIKGEKGDAGEQGVPGERGEQGIQGLQGPQGERGLQYLAVNKGFDDACAVGDVISLDAADFNREPIVDDYFMVICANKWLTTFRCDSPTSAVAVARIDVVGPQGERGPMGPQGPAGETGGIKDIDSELSDTSDNPVQNKVITQAMFTYKGEIATDTNIFALSSGLYGVPSSAANNANLPSIQTSNGLSLSRYGILMVFSYGKTNAKTLLYTVDGNRQWIIQALYSSGGTAGSWLELAHVDELTTLKNALEKYLLLTGGTVSGTTWFTKPTTSNYLPNTYFALGSKTGNNLSFGADGIQARKDGTTANTLFLNYYGGKVEISSSGQKGGLKVYGETESTTYNSESDIRLKKNIKNYKCKKSILDLPIKEFDYKKGNIHTIGCIAQDLQKICPEIVSVNEKGYLSIQESKLVYLLLQEVKDLKAEVNKLKGV